MTMGQTMGTEPQTSDLPETTPMSHAEQVSYNNELRDAIQAANVQTDHALRQKDAERKSTKLDAETKRLEAELVRAQTRAEKSGTTLTGIAAMRAAAAVQSPVDATPVEEAPITAPDQTETVTTEAQPVEVQPEAVPAAESVGLDLPAAGTSEVSQ